jgi:Uma2 family endonuclease
MILQHEKLYTTDEFFAIASLPENEGRRLELEDGVIIEVASWAQSKYGRCIPIRKLCM